jgi:hypothetical protein
MTFPQLGHKFGVPSRPYAEPHNVFPINFLYFDPELC